MNIALIPIRSLTFEDALYLLHERSKSMQKAVPEGHGAIVAVLEIKLEDIEKLIKEIKVKRIYEIANDNSDSQVILSDEKKAIDESNGTFLKKIKKNQFFYLSAITPLTSLMVLLK